jgi:DNA-binding NarL/FixJ family response regulator
MGGARKAARGGGSIRVVVADDHRTFAESLRIALHSEPGIRVVAVCHDGAEAMEAIRTKRPDVVLMDVVMPGVDGIAATRSMRESEDDTTVLMLSAQDDDDIAGRALEAGAAGFVSKSVPLKDVVRIVRAAARGEPVLAPEEVRRLTAAARKRREQAAALRERVTRLSARETEILQRMADGASPADIARAMRISPNTVRTHVQNILFKLKVHSKVEALAAAIRFGKVRAEP